MRSLHEAWGWSTVVLTGIVGVWGVLLAWRRQDPGRAFWGGVAVATTATLVQVALGVYLVAGASAEVGDQHVFYGIVVAFVLAFAYIYRAQLRRRPALAYGLLFLFVMGLSLRAIATLTLDF